MKNVIVYTTPTCVYCQATKKYFTEEGIRFSELDVASDQEARTQMIQKSGQLGVPVIEIDGQVVIGFNKKRLAEMLEISSEA